MRLNNMVACPTFTRPTLFTTKASTSLYGLVERGWQRVWFLHGHPACPSEWLMASTSSNTALQKTLQFPTISKVSSYYSGELEVEVQCGRTRLCARAAGDFGIKPTTAS